jgi:hypothetical protein
VQYLVILLQFEYKLNLYRRIKETSFQNAASPRSEKSKIAVIRDMMPCSLVEMLKKQWVESDGQQCLLWVGAAKRMFCGYKYNVWLCHSLYQLLLVKAESPKH